jgi:hypothetical protein
VAEAAAPAWTCMDLVLVEVTVASQSKECKYLALHDLRVVTRFISCHGDTTISSLECVVVVVVA